MTACIDLVGQRFGRLVVLHRVPHTPGSKQKPRWTCKCDCGTLRIIEGGSLRRGMSTSCGCFQREDMARRRTVHGYRRLTAGAPHGSDERTPKNPTYATWMGMRTRCLNPNAAGYQNYGGRGIKVCPQWETFDGFLADMGPRPPGLTLDRIDPDAGYTPENCRWVTPLIQVLNRRDRISLTARIEVIESIVRGESPGSIAERFDIHIRTVRRIRTAHLTGAPSADLGMLRALVAPRARGSGSAT